jgi:putative transposase
VIVYVDQHRDEFGVEPICSVLQFAPRTYFAARARPLSVRAVRDGELKPVIARVHAEHFGVTASTRCGRSSTAKASGSLAAPWPG